MFIKIIMPPMKPGENLEAYEARLRARAAEFDAPMSAKEKADRSFVCSYVHWDGENRKELDEATKRALDRAVWDLQDGYGPPGYTPCQGWDWSGIRDSSAEAMHNMAEAIRRVLRQAGR